MSQGVCRRCGVSIDQGAESYYKRVPPADATETADPLLFCSARCVYEYTGQDATGGG